MEIPTFEIGEEVIWHYHPVESLCAGCGLVWFMDRSPIDIEVTIIGKELELYCGGCGTPLPSTQGWYLVNKAVDKDGNIDDWRTGVPYTLLEKIK